MVFMAAVNGAPHIPGMGGWVTYGVQNREVQDGEWWKQELETDTADIYTIAPPCPDISLANSPKTRSMVKPEGTTE